MIETFYYTLKIQREYIQKHGLHEALSKLAKTWASFDCVGEVVSIQYVDKKARVLMHPKYENGIALVGILYKKKPDRPQGGCFGVGVECHNFVERVKKAVEEQSE